MAEEKKYKYDAFISYRHAEIDKFIAENLHRRLEAFRLPRNVRKNRLEGRDKIERVFRDRDELPLANNLEDPIVDAISKSDYLIVICSPRLKESMWCRKEIETFAQMHGREHMLAVLVEGEPRDSFPEELLYHEKTVWKPDGTREVVKELIEPLAADVRGKNKREMLKAMDTEILRLMAPMFDLTYDDLKQRHREQKIRKTITLASIIASIGILFGVGSTVAALRINEQKNQIEAQSAEIAAQAAEILEQSEEIEAQNDELKLNQAVNLASLSDHAFKDDDVALAKSLAYEALTESDGIEMPYTEEAQFALSNALHLYDNGRTIKATWQIDTMGTVQCSERSPSGEYVAIGDSASYIYLYDVNARKMLGLFESSISSFYDEDNFGFVDDNTFVYVDVDGYFTFYDIDSDSSTQSKEKGPYGTFQIDRDRECLYYSSLDGLCQYDIKTDKTTSVSLSSVIASEIVCSNESEYIAQYVDETIEVRNASDLELVNSIDIDGEIFSASLMDGNTLYVATTDINNMLHSSTHLYRLDLENGEIIWETFIDGELLNEIFWGYDKQNLYLRSYSDIIKVDHETGEVLDSRTTDTEIVGRTAVTSSNTLWVFTSDGYCGYVNFNSEWVVCDISAFKTNLERPDQVRVVSGAYMMFSNFDNRAVFYQTTMGPGLETSDEDYEAPEDNAIKYNQAVEKAKELQLPSANMVESLFYNDDQSVIFVVYRNNKLSIYENKKTLTLLSEIDTADFDGDFSTYCGKDKNGNYYIKSYSDGLCLSPNYKPLAIVQGLKAVVSDHLILEEDGIQYKAPIYTYEELIKLVK